MQILIEVHFITGSKLGRDRTLCKGNFGVDPFEFEVDPTAAASLVAKGVCRPIRKKICQFQRYRYSNL